MGAKDRASQIETGWPEVTKKQEVLSSRARMQTLFS